jgi:uncharacterized membrane protein
MLPTPVALTDADVLTAVFKSAAAVGAMLAALGAVMGFFLKRYWDVRDSKAAAARAAIAAQEERRTKERDILYGSLRWFEGGTQNRSIGIAVVNASWPNYPEFHALWVEVFANQAIYLLAAAKRDDKEHEQDNLRRLLDLLQRERCRLAPESSSALRHTLKRKLAGEIADGVVLSETLKKKAEAAANDLDAAPTTAPIRHDA